MISMRARLFLILLVATGALWLSAILWIQHSTRAEVERVLDARLSEAGRMVSSLISDHRVDVAQAAVMVQPEPFTEPADYVHQLSCQIWALDGTLVGQSGSAPEQPLTQGDAGFSQSIVDGVEWRVYSVVNEDLGVRVMIGDSMRVRDRLVNDVTAGLLLPAALIIPLLAGLIWIGVGRGLVPLDRMAQALAARPATDLSPLPDAPVPREIRPMTAALNGLFRRVSAAREHERSFTAFAAHELKTPLAGLKTQAQIAAMAPDEATRRTALARLERGVNRTDRMVRQLLDMATVEAEAESREHPPVSLAGVIAEVADDLAPLAQGRAQHIVQDAGAGCPLLTGNRFLVSAALRNLIENALQASPDGQEVRVSLRHEGAAWVCAVQDRGPGIAAADRARVTDRFYRGAGTQADGSGLGLAIVAAAMERIGGTLRLAPREGGGEMAELVLPDTAFRAA
ncbi:ATP-binding protein [Paracoccaceae bacterium Fryx2]|nr:ATP-binding protein [Paracoccaceae bacterium Fryx2]